MPHMDQLTIDEMVKAYPQSVRLTEVKIRDRGEVKKLDAGDLHLKTGDRVLLEADGEVKHLARFKSFSVSAVMTIRTMSGAAIGSTSGFSLMAAGDNHDAAILLPLNGAAPFKVVAPRLRSGSIPVQFRMSPEKITVRYGGETLSMPNPQSDAVHQLVLRGGNDGCMFSNLEIVGVPDPVWFKEFAKSE